MGWRKLLQFSRFEEKGARRRVCTGGFWARSQVAVKIEQITGSRRPRLAIITTFEVHIEYSGSYWTITCLVQQSCFALAWIQKVWKDGIWCDWLYEWEILNSVLLVMIDFPHLNLEKSDFQILMHPYHHHSIWCSRLCRLHKETEQHWQTSRAHHVENLTNITLGVRDSLFLHPWQDCRAVDLITS